MEDESLDPVLDETPEPSPEPAPASQVAEGVEKLKARLNQKSAALAEEREARRALEQRLAARDGPDVRDIVGRVQAHEADLIATAPDYQDAVEHLKAGRTAEWKALGLSDAEAAQRVDMEALQTAQDMLRRGQDPARGWYELAKTRGWKAPEPEPAIPSRLDAIREGQKAAVSLAHGGGRANSEPTPEAVAGLKGAAFDAAFAKLRDSAREAERRTR